jgi:diguanylate cyclase (GGDEF)-like protein
MDLSSGSKGTTRLADPTELSLKVERNANGLVVPMSSSSGSSSISQARRRSFRFVAFLALAIAGPSLALAMSFDVWVGTHQTRFTALAITFVLLERRAIRVSVGTHNMNFSPTEVPMLIAAFVLGPGAHVIARAFGSFFGTIWRIRKVSDSPTLTIAFANASTGAMEAAVFSAALGIFGWRRDLSGWFAIQPVAAGLFAGVAYHLVTHASCKLAGNGVANSESKSRIMNGLVPSLAIMTGSVTIAMAFSRRDLLPVFLAFFAVAIAIPFRQMLGMLVHGEGYRSLDEFYRYLQNTTSENIDGALELASKSAKSISAELVILEREGLDQNLESALIFGIGSKASTTIAALPRRWQQALQTSQILTRSDRKGMSESELPASRTEIISPLTVDGNVVGLLVCSDQLDSTKGIKATDVTMVERLGQHLSLWFEKDRLISQLRTDMVNRTIEAVQDPLTGLLNRRGFEEAWNSAVANNMAQAAILMVDLDYFKGVNNHKGHQGGDEVLRQVAQRLQDHLPDRSFIARFGGDEFAVCIPDLRGSDAHDGAFAIGMKLRRALAKAHVVEGESMSVGGSVGIALFPEHGEDLPELLARADAALYAAKEDPSIGVASQGLTNFSSSDQFFDSFKLKAAIDDGSVQPWYQPIIDMRTYKIAGFEALVRWREDDVFVLPSAFVPLAEKSGHIHDLTEAVMRASIPNLARWRQQTKLDLHLSINLSPLSLGNLQVTNALTNLLRSNQLPPSAIHMEVTESRVLKDPERATVYLKKLQQLGVKISLDDFGTGHSSFEWLMHLGADELKVDRVFTKDIAQERAEGIVKVQRVLATTFKMGIVAEGIETADQWNRLRALDIDYGQGFLLGKPMPAAVVDRWLREEEPYLRNTIELALSFPAIEDTDVSGSGRQTSG